MNGCELSGYAAADRTYDEQVLEKFMELTKAGIADLEKEIEVGAGLAPVHLPEKLRKAEHLLREVKTALEVLADDKGLQKTI